MSSTRAFDRTHRTFRPRLGPDGFTLIELTVTIAIAAILAAFAVSRINVTSFDADGFANQAAAMVRYAQKVAINQRRTVVVVVSGNAVALCYTDAACAGGSVHEPAGSNAFSLGPRSGVTIAGPSVAFSPLGRPDTGATLTITGGDISRTITVEAQTGYVH